MKDDNHIYTSNGQHRIVVNNSAPEQAQGQQQRHPPPQQFQQPLQVQIPHRHPQIRQIIQNSNGFGQRLVVLPTSGQRQPQPLVQGQPLQGQVPTASTNHSSTTN